MLERVLLDNPIWSALISEHASPALGSGLARRYPAASPAHDLLTLGAADVPEMLALAAATEPGPFLSETYEKLGFTVRSGIQLTVIRPR
jgi:hypothetical protein